jgi:hypothetical protein
MTIYSYCELIWYWINFRPAPVVSPLEQISMIHVGWKGDSCAPLLLHRIGSAFHDIDKILEVNRYYQLQIKMSQVKQFTLICQ